mmetsp:Transcript_8848/g.21541  ORF Transcript_8848/g.21541 Transcript_8848/m.21541 type:complete len:211 (-) Transcript_8848:1777-2409(-)
MSPRLLLHHLFGAVHRADHDRVVRKLLLVREVYPRQVRQRLGHGRGRAADPAFGRGNYRPLVALHKHHLLRKRLLRLHHAEQHLRNPETRPKPLQPFDGEDPVSRGSRPGGDGVPAELLVQHVRALLRRLQCGHGSDHGLRREPGGTVHARNRRRLRVFRNRGDLLPQRLCQHAQHGLRRGANKTQHLEARRILRRRHQSNIHRLQRVQR